MQASHRVATCMLSCNTSYRAALSDMIIAPCHYGTGPPGKRRSNCSPRDAEHWAALWPQGALHNLVVRNLMRGPHLVDPSSGAFPPRASVIILRVHAHTFAPATRCGASICNSAAAVCRASVRNTARRADHALAAHVPSLVRLVNQAETEEVDKLWTKLLPERSVLRSVEPCGAALRFGFALASARPRFALRRSGAAQHCAHCVMVSSGLATERALGRGRMQHATRMSRASS